VSPFRRLLPTVAQISQPGIHRFALQREDAEHAFVDAPQRLPTDEAFEGLDAEGELADGQRPLGPRLRFRRRGRCRSES
jgi:hypothetical protein